MRSREPGFGAPTFEQAESMEILQANERGKELDLDQDFISKASAGQIRLGMKYALVTSG